MKIYERSLQTVLSLPYPPLSRLLSRASRSPTFLRYPQMESLLAGYGKKKIAHLKRIRQSEMYAVEYFPVWPSFRKNLATPLPRVENHCGKLLVKSVCLQRQVQCTPLTIKNWPKQETARKKVSDCLTAWSIVSDLICVRRAKYSSQELDVKKK